MNTFWRFIATLVATALFTFFYTLLSLNEIPSKKVEKQGTSNKPSIASSTSGTEEDHAAQKEVENDYSEKLTDIAIKFLTEVKSTDVLLAIFTYLLFVKTGGLDDSTRKLWEAGERQIKLTEKSVKASSDAALAAFEALSIERPWVTFEEIKTSQFTNGHIDDQPVILGMTIAMIWKNYGRTPALDVRPAIRIRVVPFDERVPPTFIENDFNVLGFVIGPGKPVGTHQRALNDFEFQAFRGRHVKVIVYSKVRYRQTGKDGFFYSEICGELLHHADRRPGITEGPEFMTVFRPIGTQNEVT